MPVFFDGPRLRSTPDGIEIAFQWTALSRPAAGAAAPTAVAWWAVYRAIDEGPWIEVAEQGGDGEVVVVDRLEGLQLQPGQRLRYRVDLNEGARTITSATAELVLGAAATPGVRTQLLPNAPNPFNPRTEARFELAREGPVTLEVLDARGRRAALLLRQPLAAGLHTAVWDGRDDRGAPLASGAYPLRLVADGRVQTRVITMLR